MMKRDVMLPLFFIYVCVIFGGAVLERKFPATVGGEKGGPRF